MSGLGVRSTDRARVTGRQSDDQEPGEDTPLQKGVWVRVNWGEV